VCAYPFKERLLKQGEVLPEKTANEDKEKCIENKLRLPN